MSQGRACLSRCGSTDELLLCMCEYSYIRSTVVLVHAHLTGIMRFHGRPSQCERGRRPEGGQLLHQSGHLHLLCTPPTHTVRQVTRASRVTHDSVSPHRLIFFRLFCPFLSSLVPFPKVDNGALDHGKIARHSAIQSAPYYHLAARYIQSPSP